jgi:outer membrane protein assembly factor BamB
VAVNEDYIFTGTIGSMHYLEGLHGRFYAIDRKTGKPEWRFEVEDDPDHFTVGFASSPVIWGNWVLVGGLDGTLYGFEY